MGSSELPITVCTRTPRCAADLSICRRPHLRARLQIDKSAAQLTNFFNATVNLMKVLARACGHDHLSEFCLDDLTTYDRALAYLTGVPYAGVTPL